MSLAFSWGIERGMCPWIENPAKSVRRLRETPRQRLVTDGEYQAVYELATDFPSYISPAMELGFLCRMRPAEVLDLRRDDILPEGLRIRRRKGSRGNITEWTRKIRNFSISQGTALVAAARSRMRSGNGAMFPFCPMRSPR